MKPKFRIGQTFECFADLSFSPVAEVHRERERVRETKRERIENKRVLMC